MVCYRNSFLQARNLGGKVKQHILDLYRISMMQISHGNWLKLNALWQCALGTAVMVSVKVMLWLKFYQAYFCLSGRQGFTWWTRGHEHLCCVAASHSTAVTLVWCQKLYSEK
jgi:hypothetical protein